MQAIYFPKDIVELQSGQSFFVDCNHDEYSLWFDVSLAEPEADTEERSLGSTLISRNRLSQLNDSKTNEMFIKLLKKVKIQSIKSIL
jgi:hypothetical protein